jgi:hypothetical protein
VSFARGVKALVYLFARLSSNSLTALDCPFFGEERLVWLDSRAALIWINETAEEYGMIGSDPYRLLGLLIC